MTRYMLDTNILIYLIKHKPASVVERVNALASNDSLCMSFVTWAELLKGAAGSTRAAEVRQRLDALAREVPVLLGLQSGLCEHYATQALRLKTAGTPIGANDLWIACHALSEKATLVTNNLREFERIEGLALENWAA
ncbi:MAG TPA: type II toxin-antitoxin system VapC family toxin [Ideonella sp.]|uniref:type II toxin-antitoxin system VapC family toxin n=1 Tax=Ideonella sp. TaxID=1929293 RepID=UPI002B74922C|nr:type II toxin-antitoxin system VapC family toxin [Ideonella sp.]HSI48971.1 type II toxin-antitoxin system VapC family toxin [Ideonella sp.]